jgi:hypothetical protein
MTLQLLLGCNLVSLLDTRLITLLWRVEVVGEVLALQFLVVAVVVLVGCLHLQFLCLLVRHIPLLLAQVVLVGLQEIITECKVQVLS